MKWSIIGVLKVTVYCRTLVENCSEKVHVEIFDQKVQKTGFIPPILGGKWVSGGVGLKELKCTEI